MSTPVISQRYRTKDDPADSVRWAADPRWLSAGCLLEPLIGASWQWAFAQSLGLPLQPHHHVILGASLWLVYLADHWLDGWRLIRPRTARHQWVVRHRWPLAGLWFIVLLSAVTVAASSLTTTEWLLGCVLLACTACYFWHIHSPTTHSRHKELLVALVYTGGVSLFTCATALLGETAVSWNTFGARALACTLPFAGLVLLNLGAIAHAEREIDYLHGEDSIGRRASDLLGKIHHAALLLLVLSGLTLWLVPQWALCIGASTTALLWLSKRVHQVHHESFHVLADAALLTPLVWLAAEAWLGAGA